MAEYKDLNEINSLDLKDEKDLQRENLVVSRVAANNSKTEQEGSVEDLSIESQTNNEINMEDISSAEESQETDVDEEFIEEEVEEEYVFEDEETVDRDDFEEHKTSEPQTDLSDDKNMEIEDKLSTEMNDNSINSEPLSKESSGEGVVINTVQNELNDTENVDEKTDDEVSGDEDGLQTPNNTNQIIKNQNNEIGNFVPLLKDHGSNCPPLQYRSRSSGAIYGAGYDAGIMQDNTRSVRTKKLVRIDDAFKDIEEPAKPKPAWLKVTLSVIVSILTISALLGIYVLYVSSGYERIYDMKYLEVLNDRPSNVARGVAYEVVAYNMNYGIISSDYTYYRNTGYDVNGKEIKGSSSRAENKERVEVNTKGSAGLMSTGSNAEAEFFMFQEIDLDSTRTYYVNEMAILKDVFVNYAEIFAETGSSNYVFYPLTSPVGKYRSGMVTYSAFDVAFAMRHSMPSDDSFPTKYTATDNCISITKCKVAGLADVRYLSLFNVNISIYDDEEVRQRCLDKLYQLIKQEVERENFVVVGGSFSYSLYGNDGVFENSMKTPDWCKDLPENFSSVKLNEIGCRIVKDEVAIELKTGTTRDASVKYKKGETFEAVTDGFIVSNNVVVEKMEVLDNEFLYSSHNPVRLSFYLK